MRLAQITDLHARHHLPGSSSNTDRESRWMLELLPRAIERCKAEGAEMLLLTGDLLDVPLWLYEPMRGFELDEPGWWKGAAIADYREIKRILDASGLPYLVLPGNHDAAQWMWEVFDPDADAHEAGGLRVVQFVDYEHACHVPRRYHPTRHRWLAELESLQDPAALPQVHAQHYVITPELNERYSHTYEDAADLLQRNADAGRVRLSLSGHYHPGTELLHEGGVAYATCPAFCEPPFPFRLFDVTPDPAQPVGMTRLELGEDARPRRPVVYLDRDGVITSPARYYYGPERIELLPGAAPAIRRLNDAGFAVVVVSNQTNVGMGFVPRDIMNAVNDKFQRLLMREAGAVIDRVYPCTDAGERNILPGYRDRLRPKPDPHMLQVAAQELRLDAAGGVFVGDRTSDAQTAAHFGITPVLVRTGLGAAHEADFRRRFPDAPVHEDLPAVVEALLSG